MKLSKYLPRFLAFVFATVSVFAQGPGVRRQPVLSGLDKPVFVTNAGDGSHRLFVLEQRGLIKVVQPVTRSVSTFLDLSSLVSQTGFEAGLMGLAFHPEFATNGYFFVNYTRESEGATEIVRYKATNGNTIADPDSARSVLVIRQDFSTHNGGTIAFGPDGYLYIGMGDGGSENDPNNRAQDTQSLLGKMLRIDPDVSGNDSNPPYAIPEDNPFVGSRGEDEIWAWGFRNPYRWSFDRGGDNALWLADVGQQFVEEVNIVERAGNYGWRVYEGTRCTGLDPLYCILSNYSQPVFQYFHDGGRCAVVGGYVYRGPLGTFDQGDYVHGDFCSAEFWRWTKEGERILAGDAPGTISSFGDDELGELYLVDLGFIANNIGTVEKLVPASASSDFDGDGKSDISVFRPENGVWYIHNSGDDSDTGAQFGIAEDIPVAEDFDGDHKTDIAVFRPSSGVWYILKSSDGTFSVLQFGISTDIPVAGNYRGGPGAEAAVFRPETGVWHTLDLTNYSYQAIPFGVPGDIPVASDYDGDGRDDYSVYRPSNRTWYHLNSLNSGFRAYPFGRAGEIPAPGDFDGDGRTDPALFNESDGTWRILRSTTGQISSYPWGAPGDIPTVADYDGDGLDDLGIWRPADGYWFIHRSSIGLLIFQYGVSIDRPIPAYDRP